MALSSDPWDSTELAAYIGEVWPGLVNEEFFAGAVATNFFQDLTPFAQVGGDIFHIPNVFTNTFTPQTQSTQATEVTTEAPAAVDDTLTIDNHVYIATLLGDMDAQQIMSVYNLSEIYNRQVRGTLLEDLEGDIFALQSSVSSNTVNDTASIINDTDLRLAIEPLDSADVPLDELAFFFHPYSYWSQILAIQKYYDASQAGWSRDPSALIRSGNFGITDGMKRSLKGQLYGIPIFTSSKVVNTLLACKNLLAHKSTFAFAIQTPGGSKIRFQAANWLENIATLAVWDMINGVAEMREEAATRIDGSNAFIAS